MVKKKSRFPSPLNHLHIVLFTGDRNWMKEYAPVVRREIFALTKKHGTKNLLIIEGGAPGIDSMVKLCAHKANVHVAEVEALWETRHRSAGGQRNVIMAALKPDEVIGIHRDITQSRGTADMLRIAKNLGIPHKLVGLDK